MLARHAIFLLFTISLLYGASALANTQHSISTPTRPEKDLVICNYYKSPPFVTERGHGLVFEFTDLLAQFLGAKYRVKVQHFPRNRLDLELQQGEQCIVPFVHWSFFNDQERSRFIWSDTLLHERQEFISLSSNPIEFTGDFKVFSDTIYIAVRGHNYPEIADLIDDGFIQRINVYNENAALGMLLKQRGDFTSLPSSVYHYITRSLTPANRFYLSHQPMRQFTRHLLITANLAEHSQTILQATSLLLQSEQWQLIKRKYHLR